MTSPLGVTPSKTILAAFLFGALMLVTLPLGAQPVQGQKFGNWAVKCEIPTGMTTQRCHIFQNVIMKKDQRPVLRIRMAVGQLGKNETPGAILTLPFGFYLPPGVMLEFPDAKPVRMTFITCASTGCRAVAALSDEMIAAMKKGDRGKVTFQDLRRRAITLPISLDGFSAGYDAITGK